MDTTPDQPAEETWADIPEDIMSLKTDEILTRTRLIDNDVKVSLLTFYDIAQTSASGIGYAFRNSPVTARTECHEGEDS